MKVKDAIKYLSSMSDDEEIPKSHSTFWRQSEGMIDGDEIHIIWCVDDVLMAAPRLTRDQAREVLHEAYDNHDAQYGITWDTFEIYADMMFPKVEA